MNAFYPKYHIKILTDILDVMTDGYHKLGLESQSKIFYLLIQVAKSNIVYFYLILGEIIILFQSTSKSIKCIIFI
jgi:hypothetical protein